MKNKIVLFDIDYTLFDVSYFDKFFYKKVKKIIKIDENLIRESSIKIITELISNDHFLNIDKYINSLLLLFSKNQYKKEVEDLLFNQSFFKKGFYKDVKRTLESIGKIAKIGIYSQGDYRFQWSKIEQSELKDFFDPALRYIIKPRKLNFLPELKDKHNNDKLYLIDDKPSIIHEVKKFMPEVTTIWLKRGHYAKNEKVKNFKPDFSIENLYQAVKIIERS